MFSISPVTGAWWEELHAQKLFKGSKPAVGELKRQLFADGLLHEQVLLNKLEKGGHWIGRVPGKQSGPQHHPGCDGRRGRLHPSASMVHGGMLFSADQWRRINQPSALGDWRNIPFRCRHASDHLPEGTAPEGVSG
jgi:hypothetical protein